MRSPNAEWPDLVAALRARRAYPALFVALEHAGVRNGATYAAAARHAALLSQVIDAERSITALRQFQGALMLTLNATHAGTLSGSKTESLIASLAAVPFDNQRYDGRLADWLAREWRSEREVADALAGPAATPLRAVQWEGREYVVDLAGAARQRLLEIRKRQGGVSLDHVMALQAIAAALKDAAAKAARPEAGRKSSLASELEALAPHLALPETAAEYENDGVDVPTVLAGAIGELRLGRTAGVGAELSRVVDFLLAHVLPSWAYAPHLGSADRGALVGGDGSLRHRLGVRQLGRVRVEQPWQLAISPAARGSIGGSILGVQTALASWSLRRLSSDAVPAAPSLDSNDAMPLMLTAALINPRRLNDADLAQLAAAQAKGNEAVAQARTRSGSTRPARRGGRAQSLVARRLAVDRA